LLRAFDADEKKLFKFTEKIKRRKTELLNTKCGRGRNRPGQILGNRAHVLEKKSETITAKRERIFVSHDDQAITFPGQSCLQW